MKYVPLLCWRTSRITSELSLQEWRSCCRQTTASIIVQSNPPAPEETTGDASGHNMVELPHIEFFQCPLRLDEETMRVYEMQEDFLRRLQEALRIEICSCQALESVSHPKAFVYVR
jgi:hypothetical protein